MEYVHFLNIEYLLLRVYDIISSWGIVSGVYQGVTAPPSSALHVVALFLGNIALVGMFLSIIFFVLLVWVRIKLVIVEHEGFEKKEKQLIGRSAQSSTFESAQPKNARWERVRELANTQNESDWRLAILEADIMLDDLLKQQGYRGDSIGERLRDANPLQFSTLDLAWQAHKVRNEVAHAGEGFHLSEREANATIDLYRRVFEEFKFI